MTTVNIKELLGQEKIVFYFSSAHIMEADTMSAYDSFTKDELINKRMKLIDGLTNGNFIRMDKDKQVLFENKSALDAYNMVKDFPSQDRIQQGFQADLPFEKRK